MALSSGALKALIKSKVQLKNPAHQPNIGNTMDWLFEAVAEAVVEHIASAAVVTVTVTSVAGVTAGAGVSGPGTGTGTIG